MGDPVAEVAATLDPWIQRKRSVAATNSQLMQDLGIYWACIAPPVQRGPPSATAGWAADCSLIGMIRDWATRQETGRRKD